MKKILILIALAAFCGVFSLQASPVSPEKALDIAKKIFDAQKETRDASASVSIVWDGEFEGSRGNDVQPAFYVVARDGGGWVMVAGDDNVRPVLGISVDGTFKTEDMPDNVRWWMERIKAFVRAAKTPESGAGDLWAELIETRGNTMIPSESVRDTVNRFTPTWGQSYPLNEKCPVIDGKHTITGCVATALAELLTYQSRRPGVNMPTQGTGTVGGYEDERESRGYLNKPHVAPDAYSLGTEYMWGELRKLNTIQALQDAVNSNKVELLDNLAQLCADLGAAMHAFYSLNDTGARTAEVPYFIGEHFGFNKAARFEYASDYTSGQWVEKLRNEIYQRPVLFSGTDPNGTGGHAFILDGYGTYQGGTVFHMNFGWFNYENGYYYVDNIVAADDPFTSNCGALFDFYPDPESSYPIDLRAYYLDENYTGINLLYEEGKGYIVLYSAANYGKTVYEGQLKFMLQDKDGNEAYLYTDDDYSVVPNSVSGNGFGYLRVSNLSLGDKVVCYYKDGEYWKLLGCTPGTAVAEAPFLPAAFIDTDESYSVGDPFIFKLKNFDRLYMGTVWTITDPDGVSRTMKQSEHGVDLTKSGNYKIEAAVAEVEQGAVIEKVVTYITVKN